MAVTIIADDLTGACDTGALYAGRGPVGVFVAPELPGPDWEAAVVDTETRALPAAQAARTVRQVASVMSGRLAGRAVFKKIDSTCRGPIAAELDALVGGMGARAALVCPAFPAQGRTIVHGRLAVHGVPAHESAIGLDPDYPGATSSLLDILSSGSGLSVSLLPLEEVRGPRDRLWRTVGERRGLVAADAETDADLDALAGAARGHAGVFLAGSAGLARAAAAVSGQMTSVVAMPKPGAWLVVAGSRHPATRAQIGLLEASGVVGVKLDEAREPDSARVIAEIVAGRPGFVASGDAPVEPRAHVVDRLAALVRVILAKAVPSLVVLTGGETAIAVMRALHARRLELDGAPAPGLALGHLITDDCLPLPVLTKAGGFGAPDLFTALAKGPA